MKLCFAALFVLSFCLRLAVAEPGDKWLLAAREAARGGDRARLEGLAGELRGHMLAVYVDYWRLQPDLKNGADTMAIRAFLADNAGDYLAEKVRGDWLRQLGKQQQWPVFDAEYPALAQPDQELACYALQSRLSRGDDGVLDEAMLLWQKLTKPEKSCHPVLEALIVARRVGADDVWARVRRQVEANHLDDALHSMNYLPQSQTPEAETA